MMEDYSGMLIYTLIIVFFFGAMFATLIIEARKWRALRRKPAAIAKHIRVLEQIIADWHGTDEELDALIVLENMVLYKQ